MFSKAIYKYCTGNSVYLVAIPCKSLRWGSSPYSGWSHSVPQSSSANKSSATPLVRWWYTDLHSHRLDDKDLLKCTRKLSLVKLILITKDIWHVFSCRSSEGQCSVIVPFMVLQLNNIKIKLIVNNLFRKSGNL